jgi:hypothetical protein
MDTNYSLVAQVRSTFALLKDQRKEEASMLFKLGASINSSKSGIVLGVIADQSEVSKQRLKMCCKLAGSLNNNYERFLEEFDKIELATFDKLYSKLVSQRNRRKVLATDKLKNILLQMETELEDADTRYYSMEALRALRKRISNKLDVDMTIADKDYVKYYECSCCGLYPPPEDGFELIKVDDVSVPICDNCFAHNNSIDYKRIIKMYYNYAIQLSRLILAGTLHMNEEDLYEESIAV